MENSASDETLTVGVVGIGSIGSVLADGFDGLGHDVLVNDTDDTVSAQSPYQAVDKDIMADRCDIAVFAVPTPTGQDGGDASAVAMALQDFQNEDCVCCLRSTMPPGSTARIADETGLNLVYSPEFLRDRSGVDDFYQPDRIVIAGPEPERRRVRSLFDEPDIQCETIIETDDYLTAEIAKEAHNAFFATKVSFANQIRAIAEPVGADPNTVMDIITADRRNTTSHLDPMLGPYGGKCLPKDTEALTLFAEHHDLPTDLLRGTVRMNEQAKGTYQDVTIKGNYPNISTQSD